MEAFKIIVKLFTATDTFAPDEFVPVFHQLIQTQAIADHLLIDVADYAHVPDGPGTVLVSSQANIHMDCGQGKLGLMYVRKQPTPGKFRDRLRAAIVETLKIARTLEENPALSGRLKFKTDEIEIRINDRLLAPANEATLKEVKPDIEAVAKEIYAGKAATIEPRLGKDTLFEVRVKAAETAGVSELINRLH